MEYLEKDILFLDPFLELNQRTYEVLGEEIYKSIIEYNAKYLEDKKHDSLDAFSLSFIRNYHIILMSKRRLYYEHY